MLTRLWSFLRARFGRRPAPTLAGQHPPQPAAPEAVPNAAPALPVPPPTEPPPLEAPTPSIAAQPVEQWEDDDEDEWADEEGEALDDDGPDPFITGAAADPEPPLADPQALRTQARAEALSGEHRIPLSSPAGPGTLAEALNLLLEEGLVEAQFVETGDDAPYILYRPVA